MNEIKGFFLFLPEVRELLSEKNYLELKNFLREIHPVDIAESWDELTESEKVIIFRLLEKQKSIAVFEHLNFRQQQELLEKLQNIEIKKIIEDMAADERADLFEKLPQRTVNKLYSLMKKEDIEEVKTLLQYPEDSAGALMDTNFLAFPQNLTARQALLKLQIYYSRNYRINPIPIYIVDQQNKLTGWLPLEELIVSPPDAYLKEIMLPVQTIKINVYQKKEEIAKIFTKYDLISAPVVDEDNHLIGIITFDDILDLIRIEDTKEIYGMGKISEAEDLSMLSYIKTSILKMARSRLPWIIILLLIGTFITGRLLQGRAHILQASIVLATFLPMLMDSGGNAGAQSLTLVIRGIGIGEINFSNVWKVVKKEFFTGLLLGLFGAIIATFSVIILEGFAWNLILTVGISLFLIVTIATLTGALLPLLFKRLGFDPAVAASPFITTIVDAACVTIYFGLAQIFIF